MLLAAVSNSAAAAWVMLSESEAAVVHVDPATIQRTENRAILLELTDYQIVPDPKHPYQSAKRSYQFDCVEGALRTLSILPARDDVVCASQCEGPNAREVQKDMING